MLKQKSSGTSYFPPFTARMTSTKKGGIFRERGGGVPDKANWLSPLNLPPMEPIVFFRDAAFNFLL